MNTCGSAYSWSEFATTFRSGRASSTVRSRTCSAMRTKSPAASSTTCDCNLVGAADGMTSVDAYDLYLRGRALSQQAPPAKLQSIGFFAQATAKDPVNCTAYAAMASVSADRSIQFVPEHPADEISNMREAADKAIQLVPLLAEAHDALGMITPALLNGSRRKGAFAGQIQLDPNRSMTYDNFAMWLLFTLGRKDEALRQLRSIETVITIPFVDHIVMLSVKPSADFGMAPEFIHHDVVIPAPIAIARASFIAPNIATFAV